MSNCVFRFSDGAKKIWLLLVVFLSSAAAFSSVTSYKQSVDGVAFQLDKGLMKINICKDDIIEVKYTSLDSLAAKTSLVVNASWEKVRFTVKEENNAIVIATKRLLITINKTTNAITYSDLTGNTILAESADSNKTMKAATIAGIDTYNCTTEFNSPADEALFGLGCHPLDSLAINYKGRNQELLIKYLTGAIPVLLSTKGYGLMWDNYSASDFYGAEAGNTKYKYVLESGKEVDYYFFYGPDFDTIISCYRTATGKAPMFGKWAFGLFQSQDRYKYQSDVLSVAKKYRDNHLPVDVIVQDWFWWSPLPIGSHIMNRERYPDPKAMVDSLHNEKFHTMISIWPLFGDSTRNFNAMKSKGYLTSITWDNFFAHTFDTYYDAHNPAARKLYWQQARDSVVKRYGWDAWWVDQCEPDNGSLIDERRKAVFSVGKGIDYFNTYSLEHSKGIYEGWRKDMPGKRVFCLIRQSFAGGQRNAATLWSSDITTTFSAFRNQVPQGINSCLSGIPYWTSDIGGYISYASPEGIPDWSLPLQRELFTRWFQFGAFSPIFRIHGKGERALFSDNWDANTKDILLHYDKLRYRLLPYIYSLSAKITQENYTIMRGLAFDFRNDTVVYNIKDQYMFGPAFLVNPVTQPLSELAKTNAREVYLPQTTWYNFWTGATIKGGTTITADAPIETMPLYVRAGSIIPMGPFMEYATEKKNDTIELRIYPGADGAFTLYEDENDNYNYENGKFATITFTWHDAQQLLAISDTKGDFPGMLKQRVFNVVLVKENHGIDVENTKSDESVSYTGKKMQVKL